MDDKKKLGEILLEAGVIDKFQLKSALAEQNKWGGRLGNHLVQMGILTEELLVKALSKQLKIPYLDLGQMQITGDVLALVPQEIAEKFHLVPVAIKKIANKKTLIVAMSDPTNLDAIDELQFRTGHIIKPAVDGDTAIEMAIRRYYYGESGPMHKAGQPIAFDPAAAGPVAATNAPGADVHQPPEETFNFDRGEQTIPERSVPPGAELTDDPATQMPAAPANPVAPAGWDLPPETGYGATAAPAYAAASIPAESAPEWNAGAEPAWDSVSVPGAEPVTVPPAETNGHDAGEAATWEADKSVPGATVARVATAAATTYSNSETWRGNPEPAADAPPEWQPEPAPVESNGSFDSPDVTEPDAAAAAAAVERSIEPSVEPSIGDPHAPLPPPGPGESAVAAAEGVPEWHAADAVRTDFGRHPPEPFEPTAPGEPTNSSENSFPPSRAAGAPDEEPSQAPSPAEVYAPVAAAADGGAVDAPAWEPSAVPSPVAVAPAPEPETTVDDPLALVPFESYEGRAIRAIAGLLIEKGLLTPDELAARLKLFLGGDGSQTPQ